MASDSLSQLVTAEAVACLDYGCVKISHCLRQLTDEQVWWRPNSEMNSIGNLLLHLAGNLNQWIVAGIGDNPDTRSRQAEFDERRQISKTELWDQLKGVVEQSKAVLCQATRDELESKKRIQGFDVTKTHAMLHSVSHFQGHVQEIICLTRQQLGPNYEYQWQPQTKEEGAV